jgi:hypothetical protein
MEAVTSRLLRSSFLALLAGCAKALELRPAISRTGKARP